MHASGHFFHSLGVVILEGYGLTETTAPATVNLADKSKIGTVGPALPGVGVRLAEDGEIEVRGINVFKEYWNNPQATAEAFSEGGWFRTGDIGSFDSEGFLTVTGRKKEIIVTAGGKNVAPAALEDPIRANPIIGQVVVVGDQRPFISALITLDPEMLPTWLGEQRPLRPRCRWPRPANNPDVRAEIQRAVDAANTRVSRAESIRKFTILDSEWTEASGHLTPKMSIKRNVIMQRLRRRDRGDLRGAGHHDQRLDRRLSRRSLSESTYDEGPAAGGAFVVCQNQSLSRTSRIASLRVSGSSRER